MGKILQYIGDLTAGLLDYLGLGSLFRQDVLNIDRNKDKLQKLEADLVNINNKYANKIDYYNRAIEELTNVGLPIPNNAMAAINKKRQEMIRKRDELQQHKDLVQDYGELAKKNIDTSNMTSPDEGIYKRKDEMDKNYKEVMNNVISKDIEERL